MYFLPIRLSVTAWHVTRDGRQPPTPRHRLNCTFGATKKIVIFAVNFKMLYTIELDLTVNRTSRIVGMMLWIATCDAGCWWNDAADATLNCASGICICLAGFMSRQSCTIPAIPLSRWRIFVQDSTTPSSEYLENINLKLFVLPLRTHFKRTRNIFNIYVYCAV